MLETRGAAEDAAALEEMKRLYITSEDQRRYVRYRMGLENGSRPPKDTTLNKVSTAVVRSKILQEYFVRKLVKAGVLKKDAQGH